MCMIAPFFLIMNIINVNCSKSYNIYIGENFAEFSQLFCQTLCKKKVALLISENVDKRHIESLLDLLSQTTADVYSYTLNDGENFKNTDNLKLITAFLQLNDFSRKDVIINVGGGTVCDCGGFLAGLYKIGIAYINIPTTLLCAVDACIGGKTAIDVNGCKNLWGLFNQPECVFINLQLIKSLPNGVFEQGISEIIKYGIIDARLGDYLTSLKGDLILALKAELQNIIMQCLSVKSEYVHSDEFDFDKRRDLNLGHTFAHAIESLSSFKIDHARAVATGLYYECLLAYKCGEIPQERYNKILSLLNKYFTKPDKIDIEKLIPHMKSDKKNEGGLICFSIPCGESGIKQVFYSEGQIKSLFE